MNLEKIKIIIDLLKTLLMFFLTAQFGVLAYIGINLKKLSFDELILCIVAFASLLPFIVVCVWGIFKNVKKL
ncbi:hypothetical protein RDZ95_001326 [Campylobacter upsaliensis]|nr:hypothetical protein [Campylobacter upsaliensis]